MLVFLTENAHPAVNVTPPIIFDNNSRYSDGKRTKH